MGLHLVRCGPKLAQHLEDASTRTPLNTVTREYKVFRGYDQQPTSEVRAQIDFVPPDMKTYKITQA